MSDQLNNLTVDTSLPILANVDEPRLCVSSQIYHVDYNNKMSDNAMNEFADMISAVCEARTKSYLPNETNKKLVRITFLPKIGSLAIIKGIACIHAMTIKPVFVPDHQYFMMSIPRDQIIPTSVLQHIRHVLLKDDDKLIIEMSSGKRVDDVSKTIISIADTYKVNRSLVAYCET